MVHLTLAGLSEDGKRLLLVDDKGAEFTLDADATLRKALRGEHERLGQLEIHMDSALRPRDIQARIRAGETPEAVAQAAQTTVDRIMPFANPVLAERAHVADRAQRASVRRPAGEAGARTLGEAVGRHLRELNVPEESVEWDAWRREDGRWTLTGRYATSKRKGPATFPFAAPGNFGVAEDDDAKWLVGEAIEQAPRPGSRQPRQRRLSAVAADELPLGEDAIEMVTGDPSADTVDLSETAERVRRTRTTEEPTSGPDGDAASVEPTQESALDSDSPFLASAFRRQNGPGDGGEDAASPTSAEPGPARATDDDPDASQDPVPDADRAVPVDGASPVDAVQVHTGGNAPVESGEPDAATSQDDPADAEPPRRRVSKKRGRASVPSWAEIRFGSGNNGWPPHGLVRPCPARVPGE